MKIEFDTATLSHNSAMALTRLLGDLFPRAAPKFGPDDRSKLELMRAGEWPPAEDPRAVDGFPMAPAPEELENAEPLNPPAVAPGQLDSAGTPWDERIHASTRTTNKDGSWTRRRNTPDAVFDAVMAELKGTAPAPEPEETNAAAAFAPAPPAPPAPAAIPTPPAPAAAGSSFVDLMKIVTEGQASGKLTKEVIDSVVQGAGAAGLGELVKPDAVAKRAAIIAQLSALLA